MSDFCARYGKYREMVNFLRKYLGDFLIASYLDVIQESGYDAVYVKEIEVIVFLQFAHATKRIPHHWYAIISSLHARFVIIQLYVLFH